MKTKRKKRQTLKNFENTSRNPKKKNSFLQDISSHDSNRELAQDQKILCVICFTKRPIGAYSL